MKLGDWSSDVCSSDLLARRSSAMQATDWRTSCTLGSRQDLRTAHHSLRSRLQLRNASGRRPHRQLPLRRRSADLRRQSPVMLRDSRGGRTLPYCHRHYRRQHGPPHLPHHQAPPLRPLRLATFHKGKPRKRRPAASVYVQRRSEDELGILSFELRIVRHGVL